MLTDSSGLSYLWCTLYIIVCVRHCSGLWWSVGRLASCPSDNSDLYFSQTTLLNISAIFKPVWEQHNELLTYIDTEHIIIMHYHWCVNCNKVGINLQVIDSFVFHCWTLQTCPTNQIKIRYIMYIMCVGYRIITEINPPRKIVNLFTFLLSAIIYD